MRRKRAFRHSSVWAEMGRRSGLADPGRGRTVPGRAYCGVMAILVAAVLLAAAGAFFLTSGSGTGAKSS